MREQGPRATLGPLACVSLAALALGCADRRTVAGKSADAYDLALRSDAPAGKGHGHGSSPDGSSGPGKAQEEAHGEAAGHSAAGSRPSAASGPGRRPDVPHAGHGSSAAPPQETSGHAGMAHHDEPIALQPEAASSTAVAGAPAASLRADDLDAPVPTAAAEALRAERLAAEMAEGAHSMHHGTYSHTDAGRESTDSAPAPSDDVHRGHDVPPVSTKPPASGPAPVPAHDHSHHGAASPAPKPSPRPTPRPTPSPAPHHQEHR
jgi:hypothetical protein